MNALQFDIFQYPNYKQTKTKSDGRIEGEAVMHAKMKFNVGFLFIYLFIYFQFIYTYSIIVNLASIYSIYVNML